MNRVNRIVALSSLCILLGFHNSRTSRGWGWLWGWRCMGCRCYSLGDGGLDGNLPRLDTGVCVSVGVPVAVDVAVGENLEPMNGGGGKSYVRHITTPFTKFTTFLNTIRLHRKFTKVKVCCKWGQRLRRWAIIGGAAGAGCACPVTALWRAGFA